MFLEKTVDSPTPSNPIHFMIKTRLPIVLVLGLVSFAVAHAADRWETLEAIHRVENPRNSTRVGAHGELGPYQFRISTWRMYTTKPFTSAINREEADRVAVMHYEWIKAGLEHHGIEASAYNIALAWNGGLDALLRGHTPRASYAYAEQVFNVAQTVQRKQLASADR